MPQDRFIHPKRGKLSQFTGLTDLEWRVHDAYLVAADNFGVMRCSSHTLKSVDEGLATKPDRTLLRCLEALIDRGILVDFKDGDRRFLCQLDWQDDQKVKYPTRTYDPKPPDGLLERMSPKTRALFTRWPGANSGRDRDEQEGDTETSESEKLADDSEKISETVPKNLQRVSRAASWLEANGLRLTAFKKEEGQREWFAAFYASYPKKQGRDKAWKAWLKLSPDPELRAQIAAALEQQRHQPDWRKDRGQFIPLPATWLNGRRWEDELVPETPHLSRGVANLAAANVAFLEGE